MKIFHYIRKGHTALKDGILSFSRNPHADLGYYYKRSGQTSHEGICQWLESCFEGRSRGIRGFSEPIKWTENSLSLQKFVEEADLFSIDLTAMEKDGLIEAVYCSPAGEIMDVSKIEYGTDEILVRLSSVEEINTSPVDWGRCNDALGLRFYVVPYYVVIVKNGIVPPDYIHLER